MSIILTPFAKLVLLFYDITGSYGVSLILFCLVIRAVLFPVFLKGRKSMLAMNGLAEQQKILQQKYARDRERYSIELQKLYDREGVKPSGGCLWSILPLAFLMPLYGIVRRPLTYLLSMSEDNFNAVSNLLYGTVKSYSNDQLGMAQDVFVNYDKIVSSIPELSNMPKIDFTFLGINLSDTPHLLFWQQPDVGAAFALWMIPIISALLGVVSMLVTNKINAYITGVARTMDPTTRSTMLMMPLMSLWICFTLPGALGLYWVANSVFAILSEFLNVPFLKKHLKKLEEDKVKRIEEEKERVKREKKVQAEARKKAQEEMRRIQMERKLNQSIASASRVGMRTYARGRLYDPGRYPTFPYQDPNDLYQEELARRQKQTEEAKSARESKKDKAIPAPEETVTPVEEPVTAPEETPADPVEPAPVQPEEAAEEEEGFVEESFLEEPEDNGEEK